MLKQARGSALLVEHGWSTNAREARITTGTKFSRNVRRLQRENGQLAEALRPWAEFQREFGNKSAGAAIEASESEPENGDGDAAAPNVVQLQAVKKS